MLQETSVEKALQSFGLTKKEAQIYIFLSKHGLQKGIQITLKTGTAKAVVYRILKVLQRKGFVEATLESPVRFKAVPFKNILDSEIKARHDEAIEIENTKDTLLSDWDKIRKAEPTLQVERFVTIEGNQRIYRKIYEMVKTTKQELSIITTVSGIMRSDRFGITNEIINHPLRKRIKVRFLTDLAEADMKAIQFLKKKLKTSVDLRGRNTELGLKPFPRMVIRDKDEILFFISQKTSSINPEIDESCLCTNCRSLIDAFSGVFEDLWRHSTDLEQKIIEVQTGKQSPTTVIIENAEIAKNQYLNALNTAEKEVLFITSPAGLTNLSNQFSMLHDWANRKISIRIMAPITIENLDTTQKLMQWCEIRHVSFGYFETTIIDNRHLFQFNKASSQKVASFKPDFFKNTFYTNDLRYIQKTRNLINDIWEKTRTPLGFSLNSSSSILEIDREFHKTIKKIDRWGLQKIRHSPEIKKSEIDVLNKINEAKSNPSKYWSKTEWSDTQYFFGSRAFALIRPPKDSNLPDMIISVFQNIECSTYGAENIIKVFVKPENRANSQYQLVAQIQDNLKSMNCYLATFNGMLGGNNIKLVDRNQISVSLKGNTLFAGWTVPIQISEGAFLPPSCIIFEGYGIVHSGIFDFIFPSGKRQEIWFNNLEAFATFFHKEYKYVCPASEGMLDRESIQISHPPQSSLQ